MKENKYDDEAFFAQYRQFPRSMKGLQAAGEWHELQRMLPDFAGKRVLDLGCGFGWHCRYAAEQGAASVLGIDLSERMLAVAREKTDCPNIEYRQLAIEELEEPQQTFDIVLSSLALHYVAGYETVCEKVYKLLAPGGTFVFSVEHPIFTAHGSQDWAYDLQHRPAHWPVDHYFTQGLRNTHFLGEAVIKYHRTVTSYVGSLLKCGFELTGLCEPQPAPHLLATVPAMKEELRRPMMLILSAKKPLEAEA